MGGLYSICQSDDTSPSNTKSGDVTATSAIPPEINTVAERPSVAQKLISNGLIPDVLNKAVAEPAIVKYGLRTIKLDNAELTPTETKDLPTVTWTGKSELYAVFLTDPDAISREQPIFREFVHFAALNVKATVINANSCGDVALEYAGPAPPYNSGLHRYVWLIYSQEELMDTEPLTKYLDGRGGKKVNGWAKDNGLTLVAANVFESQWDEHCDAAHVALDFVPPPKYQSPKQVEALKAAAAAANAAAAEMQAFETPGPVDRKDRPVARQDEQFNLLHGISDTSFISATPEVLIQQEEELHAVAAKNLVNPGSIAATGDMLSDKLQKQAMDNKMEKEEQEELKDLASKDLVNPDTMDSMGEMLSDQLQQRAIHNKQEQEEQEELKKLADKDLVNDHTKEIMEDLLEEKIVQKALIVNSIQDNKHIREEQSELNQLEKQDLVNDSKKQKVEAILATKKDQEKGKKKLTVPEEYARRLALIYKNKAPDKIKMIASLLKEHEGAEHELYVDVAKKYGLKPEPQYFAPGKRGEFNIGDEVFLIKLYADTDLNEQDGVVVELANDKGKYLVQLHSSGEKVRVMAKNMSNRKNKDGPKQKALQHMMVAGIGSFSEQQEMERRYTAPEAPPDPDATPAALASMVG